MITDRIGLQSVLLPLLTIIKDYFLFNTLVKLDKGYKEVVVVKVVTLVNLNDIFFRTVFLHQIRGLYPKFSLSHHVLISTYKEST